MCKSFYLKEKSNAKIASVEIIESILDSLIIKLRAEQCAEIGEIMRGQENTKKKRRESIEESSQDSKLSLQGKAEWESDDAERQVRARYLLGANLFIRHIWELLKRVRKWRYMIR